MENATVSYASKKQVDNFILKYPIVKSVGIGKEGLLKLQNIALNKQIPFTVLLSCIYTYLNFKPVKILHANNNEYLMYNLSNFAEIQVNCAIRNNE